MNTSDIETAKQRIEVDCLRQVVDGQQSKTLPTGYVACGQFLKRPDRSQRGLHGVAAAMELLAASQDQNQQAALEGLLNYLADRINLETGSNASDAVEDSSNVIKTAEVLHALAAVSPTIAADKHDTVRRQYLDQLQSLRQSAGWGYYGPNESLLPTLMAVRALDAVGVPVDRALFKNLLGQVTAKPQEDADFSVRIFGVYALSSLVRTPLTASERRSLKKALIESWHAVESLMAHDFEANIEYEFETDEHRYVRVPWQLYLIAASSRLAPLRVFSSVPVRRRLDAVLRQTKAGGFRYPHSGSGVSTRTSAIVHGLLRETQARLEHPGPIRIGFLGIDYLRRGISSGIARAIYAIAAVLLAGYSILLWLQQDQASLGDLAPDLLAPLLLVALASVASRPS